MIWHRSVAPRATADLVVRIAATMMGVAIHLLSDIFDDVETSQPQLSSVNIEASLAPFDGRCDKRVHVLGLSTAAAVGPG